MAVRVVEVPNASSCRSARPAPKNYTSHAERSKLTIRISVQLTSLVGIESAPVLGRSLPVPGRCQWTNRIGSLTTTGKGPPV